MGEHVGSIQKIDGKRLNVNLLKGIELHNGDGICFLDENNELQGFNVNGVDGNSILTSFRLERSGMEKSQTTERDFSTPLRYARNDKLYRNYDIVWQKSVETSDGNRKIAIRLKLSDTAEGLKLSAFVDDTVSADVEIHCQKDIAKNPEKSLENIRTKLSQWGDTKFTIEFVDIDFKEIYFIPNSVLGELKRQLVVKLEETLVKRHFDCSEAEWRNLRLTEKPHYYLRFLHFVPFHFTSVEMTEPDSLFFELFSEVNLPHLLHIMLHHDFHQFFEACLTRVPSQLCLRFCRITKELIYFGGTEIPRIHLYEDVSSLKFGV
jgi:hypothetical protein